MSKSEISNFFYNESDKIWKSSETTPFSVDDILNSPGNIEKLSMNELNLNISNYLSNITQQSIRSQQLWIESVRKLHIALNANPLLFTSCLPLPGSYHPVASTTLPFLHQYQCSPHNLPLSVLNFYDGIIRNAHSCQPIKQNKTYSASEKQKHTITPSKVSKEEEDETASIKNTTVIQPVNDNPPLSPIHALEKLASHTFHQLENSKQLT